jgi:hypothetical protein
MDETGAWNVSVGCGWEFSAIVFDRLRDRTKGEMISGFVDIAGLH